MSFGHGISVTPIQLVNAVSAVANDGMLLKPRLVNKITDKNGKIVKKIDPIPVRQVVSKETARRTRKLLENVVAEGTGKNAKIKGYRIGGKTGTAKHYNQEIYDSSFIGILPVDNPQLVILVVLYDISGYPYYGSQTAAPIFRNVALDTLRYLDIPPSLPKDSETSEPSRVIIPDVINMKSYNAEKSLRNKGFDVKLVGNDNKIVKQVPLAGARIKSNSTVILFTNNKDLNQEKYYMAVPDLKDMKTNKARSLLAELGLKLVISGDGKGKISEQSVKPGERVKGGSSIVVETDEND
jgi:stage V sporulation protein D (sporulation-specific penicillin-binding protein)